MRTSHLARGFTLTELLVAIGIIGILASLTMAAYGRMMRNERINTAADRVLSALQNTRSMAINNNSRYTILFTPPQITPTTPPKKIAALYEVYNHRNPLKPEPVEFYTFDIAIQLFDSDNPTSSDAISVIFEADGSAITGTGTLQKIKLADEDHARQVVVFPGGMVKLQKDVTP